MKWVVGSIAVVVALALGVALGWTMRGPAPSPPPAPLPPPPVVSVAPPVTSAKPPAWVEDIEVFAWPASASDDVVVVDATHYLVKRAYLVKVTSNAELSSARVAPAMVDGGVIGVKVFGIRAGSPAARLGLANGDTVETLNGISVARPEDALEAYTHVRDGKQFVLAIERAGAHVDIHYRVLD